MTIFWIVSALLIVIAILFVVLPLWRGGNKSNAVARDAANLEVFRDQIAEMDLDLSNGLLTPELHEQGKRELQSRLLEEVKDEQIEATLRSPLKKLAIALAIALPLATVGLYLKIGNPNAFSPEAAMMSAGVPTNMSMSAAIKTLEALW